MTNRQCRSKPGVAGINAEWMRCQAYSGHGGLCWTFAQDGVLIQWTRKTFRLKQSDIAETWIPPTHPKWIHPNELERYTRDD